MFITLILIGLFLATLTTFKARRGRISRLVLLGFATAWSAERLDRQDARRRTRRPATR